MQSSFSPLIELLIAIGFGTLFALAGVAIALVGRRGRRTDDHPLCRRCGFDLTGKPTTSDRCPECGADLAGPRAIVVGHRAPRRGWLIVGLTLFTLSVFATLAMSISIGSRVDWQAAKPAWWLLRESQSTSRTTRGAALDALCNRFAADRVNPLSPQLGSANERLLIARLLEVQADATIPWKRWWGDGIAARIEDGTLPPDERNAFLRAIFASPTLVVRQDVRAGDGLPMELTVGGRGPAQTKFAVRFDWRDCQTSIDQVPTPAPTGGGESQSSLSNGSLSQWHQLDSQSLAAATPGAHEVEFRTIAHVRSGFEDDARELATIPLVAAAPFTMHPADATLVGVHRR